MWDNYMRAELDRLLAKLALRFADGDACCRDLAVGRGASEVTPLDDDSVARILAGFEARVNEETMGESGPDDLESPSSIECPEPVVESHRPPSRVLLPTITLPEPDPLTRGPFRYLSRGPISRDRDRHGRSDGSSPAKDLDREDRDRVGRRDGRDHGGSPP